MTRIIQSFIALCVLGCGIIPASAQIPATARVVASCGDATYVPGANNPITVDTTGALCGSGGGGGSGTVTSVSVVTANGISGTVANPTTTPAITLTAQNASNSQLGFAQCDGTTITCSSGILTAAAGAGPFLPLAGGTMSGNIAMGSNAISGATTIGASGIISTSGAGSAANPEITVGNSTTGLYSVSTTGLGLSVNGTVELDYGNSTAGRVTITPSLNIAGAMLNFTSASGVIQFRANASTQISSPATATYQLGPADAASPVAQTLQVQNVVAGSTNTAAVTWTLQGSLSNGSGGGGNIVLQTTKSTASSGVQNTALAGITILGGNQLVEINQITTDAALTDTTVCQDTTLHGLHAGSGTAGICLGNVSSIRYKHDWQNIGDGLGIIDALDPGTYRYNEGIADGGTQLRVGFTAERYASVLPAFTRYDSEGRPNGLDMLAAFPFAVRAIQQLDKDKVSRAEFDAYRATHP